MPMAVTAGVLVLEDSLPGLAAGLAATASVVGLSERAIRSDAAIVIAVGHGRGAGPYPQRRLQVRIPATPHRHSITCSYMDFDMAQLSKGKRS